MGLNVLVLTVLFAELHWLAVEAYFPLFNIELFGGYFSAQEQRTSKRCKEILEKTVGQSPGNTTGVRTQLQQAELNI